MALADSVPVYLVERLRSYLVFMTSLSCHLII